MAAPPLPDIRALVAGSPWVAERDGLAAAAADWQRTLPPVRARLDREAELLARPRVWVDTITTLATTGWRMASSAAPEAPLTVLTAAAGAFGLPVGPTGGRGSLHTAEQIVRAGGPAYVKLGQFIASADGLLPKEWVEAFAWCRDQVPPAPDALAVVQREIGLEHFTVIEPESFAAASIGQVHRATLTDGTEVVVKVRRPRLRSSFARDIEALALVAAAAHRLHEGIRIANLPGFVQLFAQLALQELDFRLEALNMVELGACLGDAGLDYVRIPRPIPGLVTERVLVMEALPGVPYTEATDVDGDRLLNLAITGVLEGTLAYGRFHGDLHAGNVLIADNTFSLVDFGICGRLDAEQRQALVRFLLGFSAMDAKRQLDALEVFGAFPPDADRDALARELQAEIDALPAQVTVDTLAENLGGALRILAAHGYSTPKELVLFFKNVLYLSGFASAIAPDADLLGQIGPVLAYFSDKYGDELFAMALG